MAAMRWRSPATTRSCSGSWASKQAHEDFANEMATGTHKVMGDPDDPDSGELPEFFSRATLQRAAAIKARLGL